MKLSGSKRHWSRATKCSDTAFFETTNGASASDCMRQPTAKSEGRKAGMIRLDMIAARSKRAADLDGEARPTAKKIPPVAR